MYVYLTHGRSTSSLSKPKRDPVLQDHYTAAGDRETGGLLVKGGLWEVDLYLRKLKPCYWPGQASRVLRGTWFVEKGSDWVPLKVCSSKRIAMHIL